MIRILSTYKSPITIMQDLHGITMIEEPWASDWLLYLVVLPLILYAVVISVERFPAIWLSKVVYSNRFASTAFRNRAYGRHLGHSLLFIISFISLSTFCYFLEVSYGLFFFSLKGIALWFLNLSVLSLAVALRFVIIKLLGELTGSRDTFEEYGFNIAQFYKFLAIPLLLVNFFIPYFEGIPDIVLFITALIMITSVLIIRIFRLAVIFNRRGISLLYFILYLCALEFTPTMVFVKYLSGAV
jgi:hypothetical protein